MWVVTANEWIDDVRVTGPFCIRTDEGEQLVMWLNGFFPADIPSPYDHMTPEQFFNSGIGQYWSI